jgi:ankyrin repeat protein
MGPEWLHVRVISDRFLALRAKMKNRYHLAMILALSITVASVTAQAIDDIDILELAKTGSLQDIQAALQQAADVNAMDAGGETPLMYAAGYNKNCEVITMLLTAGADPYARDDAFLTPLMYATENNPAPKILTVLQEPAMSS